MAVVAEGLVGFCVAEVNVEGPVQLYAAPAIVPAVKLIGLPEQTGLLLPAIGAAGTGFTVMVIPVEVTLVGLAQPELEVMVQVTTWPFVSALVV